MKHDIDTYTSHHAYCGWYSTSLQHQTPKRGPSLSQSQDARSFKHTIMMPVCKTSLVRMPAPMRSIMALKPSHTSPHVRSRTPETELQPSSTWGSSCTRCRPAAWWSCGTLASCVCVFPATQLTGLHHSTPCRGGINRVNGSSISRIQLFGWGTFWTGREDVHGDRDIYRRRIQDLMEEHMDRLRLSSNDHQITPPLNLWL